MYNFNRKQRRDMEEKLGLRKEYRKMTEAQQAEIKLRRIEAGKQIHLRNLQELENKRIQDAADLFAKQVQRWIDAGKTPEEADEIVKRNYELVETRKVKIADKKARREKNKSGE